MSPANILLLPEDSSRDSDKILQVLVTKSLRYLDGACPTEQIKFEPATDEAREIARATGWKDETPTNYEKRRRVLGAIANKISQPGNFVVFHFDGDEAWANRANSENLQQFDTKVKQRVSEMLTQPIQKRTANKQTRAPLSKEEVERVLARLLPMVPFHSMESWLYQNTKEAIQICESARYKENERQRARQQLEAWEGDRGALDEHEKKDPPKKKICLWSDHNQTLAERSFPAREVYNVGKSFKAFVDSLRAIIEHIDKPYVEPKQEELLFWWRERGFHKEKLPTVRTRNEIDRLLSLLEDPTMTEDELLTQLNQTPDGFPGQAGE